VPKKKSPGVRRPAREPRRGTRAAHWLPLVVPALLVLAAYAPTLGYDFVWDDQNFIVENPAAHSIARLPESLQHGYGWVPALTERADAFLYFRPVIVVANTLHWALSGGSPWLFHLANVLTHAICAALVGWILLRLRVHWSAALLAGGLFALHPIHSEAVAWISGRTDLSAGLFGLLAVGWVAPYLSAVGPRAVSPPASSTPSASFALTGWVVAGWGSVLLLGLLSKESAVAVVALLALLAWSAGKEPGEGVARRFWWVMLGIAGLYLLARFAVLGENAAGGGAWRGLGEAPSRGDLGARLLLGGNLMLLYLWRFLVPWPLAMDPPASLVAPPYPLAPGLAGILTLAVLGGVFSYLLLRPSRRLGVGATAGIGLLWLGLLPVLQIIPTGEVYGERFLYLPVAGLLIALSSITRRFWRVHPGWAVSCLMLLAVPYLYLLESRLPDWRNEITLFGRAVEVHPESARAHANLGAALMEAHRHEEARGHLEEAVRLDPSDPWKQAQFGSLLVNVGEVERGMTLLETARREGKVNATLLLNLGLGHLRLGQAEQAVSVLEQARRLAPQDAKVIESLASAERKRGRYERAEQLYREALRIEPTRKSCYLNLFGMHYFDRLDGEAARPWGHELLRRFPGAPEAEQTRQLMQRPPGPPRE